MNIQPINYLTFGGFVRWEVSVCGLAVFLDITTRIGSKPQGTYFFLHAFHYSPNTAVIYKQ